MDYMGRFTVEEWAREWLDERRGEGEALLEIKASDGNHYVYRSTTHYDRDRKGPKKDSEYIGTLKLTDGRAVFTPKKGSSRRRDETRSIREAGPLRLLDRCAEGIPRSLERRFPDDWDSLYALALLGCVRRTPLKSAATLYGKFEPVRNMRPPMSADTLSLVLRRVGSDREAQLLFFRDTVPDGAEIAFDLTELFSTSGELTLSEKGRNPEHDGRSQVNIAMACTLDAGEPSYIRAIPGSVRDVKALCASLREMGLKGAVLVGDRGFHSAGNVEAVLASGMDYVFPVRRNSALYEQVSVGETDFFFWKDRVIRYGKARPEGGPFLYRFMNDEMAMSEDRNALAKVRDGTLGAERYMEAKPRMGHMVIVSDLDRDPEWIYGLYKRRDRVEKRFRTLFSILESDSTYMRDTDALRGYVFAAFISLKIVSRLEARIRDAGLLQSMSVDDVLLEYSKAYCVETEGGTVHYEIPASLEKLDSKLGFNIFPILGS